MKKTPKDKTGTPQGLALQNLETEIIRRIKEGEPAGDPRIPGWKDALRLVRLSRFALQQGEL